MPAKNRPELCAKGGFLLLGKRNTEIILCMLYPHTNFVIKVAVGV